MPKPSNPWISHLMNTRNNLPDGTSLKKAMKLAKKTYKKTANLLSVSVGKKTRGNKKQKRLRRKSRRMVGGEDIKPIA